MTIFTHHPHPVDSPDYTHPWGARNDDTHSPEFVQWVKEHASPGAFCLDLGCAGGGLVADLREAGFEAYGIEGSTAPKEIGREAWLKYPDAFFHADLGKPWIIAALRGEFEVISAWEVLEHIPEQEVGIFLRNVASHLKPGGWFAGTISLREDVVDGIRYHQTVKDLRWWAEQFSHVGLLWFYLPFDRRARKEADSAGFAALLA